MAIEFDSNPFFKRLKQSADQAQTMLCMGIDPVLSYIPDSFAKKGMAGFVEYVHELCTIMVDLSQPPSAFKLNIGFFSCFDTPLVHHADPYMQYQGSHALAQIITLLKEHFPHIPLILDSKRGDIYNSSIQYAKEAFITWDCDATTVSPYMGKDSIQAFAEYASQHKRGLYVLVRTSNVGAHDFMDIHVSRDPTHHAMSTRTATVPLYRYVQQGLLTWSQEWNIPLGMVFGANTLSHLNECFTHTLSHTPLLLPGIGTQGGTAHDLTRLIRESAYPPWLVRANVSRSLLYPWIHDTMIPSNQHWRAYFTKHYVQLHASLNTRLP